MSDEPRLRHLIEQAAAQPTRVRRLLDVAGVVTRAMEPHRVVLVGGLAVAYWTAQQEATDIDVAMPDTRELARVLSELGFERALGERHWVCAGADAALEVPAARVTDHEHVIGALSPSGHPLNVLSPADLLVWRLDEFVGTGHPDAGAQMVALAATEQYLPAQALRHAASKGLTPALALADVMIGRWRSGGPLESDELHRIAEEMMRACYFQS